MSRNYLRKIQTTLQVSYEIAKTHFKLKNEGSYLGILWYILNPVSMFFVILFIKRSTQIKTEIVHYPIYLLFGLIFFNFFNTIIQSSLNLVSENASLIRSIKTPIEILILSKVIQGLFSHGIELILIGFVSIAFNLSITGFIYYIILSPFIVMFALGLSMTASMLGAYIRDAKNIWTIFYQLLLFISLIAYAIPSNTLLHTLNLLNPFFYFLEVMRGVILNQTISNPFLLIGMVSISTATLAFGILIFNKYKKNVAELI